MKLVFDGPCCSLLPKIKNIPKNTNGRLAIPALAGLLVESVLMLFTRNYQNQSVLDETIAWQS